MDSNLSYKQIPYGIGEEIILENGFIRVARSPHKINYPESLNNDLAYLAGYHLGDGYLEDVYKTYARVGKGGWEIDYSDSDKEQISIITSIIKNNFCLELSIYNRPNKNLWIAKGECKAFHWYLNEILELPYGRKSIISIPRWIIKEKEFLNSFLSGFFDAEGDVGKTLNGKHKGISYFMIRIQLTQKDRNILNQIKDILQNIYKIKSSIHKKFNRNAFILKINSRYSINIFRETINFRNPKKREKLERLCQEVPHNPAGKINRLS